VRAFVLFDFIFMFAMSAQSQKIGRPNNQKALRSGISKGLNRIAKIG
jgi:hypothetical protein